MQFFDRILTKEYIQERFVKTISLVLSRNKSLTKASLAESLNVKPAKFSEVLNYRMKPGIDMIALLCEYWDVSPDWILISRGPVFRDNESKQPIWVQENLETEPPYNIVTNKPEENSFGDNATHNSLYVTQLLDKISSQAEEIGRLKARLEQIERSRGVDASDANHSDIADVG